MKTRRFLGWVAMATMVLSTSCSNDEVVNDYSPKNAIQFSTYMGRNVQSRAAELTTDGLKDKGFGVFAFYTGQDNWDTKNPANGPATSTPNFMFNQEVTYTAPDDATGSWGYSPVKYWPETKNDKISFFAYGPYDSNTNKSGSTTEFEPSVTTEENANTTTGAPTVKFTQSTDVTKMVDFVAAVAMNQTGPKTDYTSVESKTVEFKLKHELTRLNFGAKLNKNAFISDDPKNQTRINITSVKIVQGTTSKFYQSAEYTFATANDDGSNLYRGAWSNHAVATADLDLDGILNTTVPSDIGTGEDAYDEEGIMLKGTEVISLFKGKMDADDTATPSVEEQAAEYVFLIPPVQTNGTTGLVSGDVINVTFSYDIITMDEKLAKGYSMTSATKTVALPTGAVDNPETDGDESKANTLQQGKAYKFIFTFGLHEVKVSASVEGWGEEDGGGTDVDWTDTDTGGSSTGSGGTGDGDTNV